MFIWLMQNQNHAQPKFVFDVEKYMIVWENGTSAQDILEDITQHRPKSRNKNLNLNVDNHKSAIINSTAPNAV